VPNFLLVQTNPDHETKDSVDQGTMRANLLPKGDIIGYISIYSYIPLEANMGLVKKSITVTDHQEKWIRAQVESGQYGNDSEYFRDLLRRDEEQNAKFQALKAAIQEGLYSGVSDKTVLDVWREAEERYTAKHG